MGATRLTFPEGGLRLSAISLQRFLCIELCFCYCAQYSLRRNSVGKKREAGLLCLRLRWRVLKLSPYFVYVCVGIYIISLRINLCWKTDELITKVVEEP